MFCIILFKNIKKEVIMSVESSGFRLSPAAQASASFPDTREHIEFRGLAGPEGLPGSKGVTADEYDAMMAANTIDRESLKPETWPSWEALCPKIHSELKEKTSVELMIKTLGLLEGKSCGEEAILLYELVKRDSSCSAADLREYLKRTYGKDFKIKLRGQLRENYDEFLKVFLSAVSPKATSGSPRDESKS
jgi:hypothetical protein